jgi:hypothetical protein
LRHVTIKGQLLNQVQVENLRVANLIGINLFTSSLELTISQLELQLRTAYVGKWGPDRRLTDVFDGEQRHKVLVRVFVMLERQPA